MNTTKSDPVKIDLEQLLREGNIIRIKPQGYSMYPLFIPGRDEALIQQTDGTDCHRNDVVLYRRDQGILVLHRICRITSDGFYMVGDNQYEVEGPLRQDQIIGKLIAVNRNSREFTVGNPFYKFVSSLWLLCCLFAPSVLNCQHFLESFITHDHPFFIGEFLFSAKSGLHSLHLQEPQQALSHTLLLPVVSVHKHSLPVPRAYK